MSAVITEKAHPVLWRLPVGLREQLEAVLAGADALAGSEPHAITIQAAQRIAAETLEEHPELPAPVREGASTDFLRLLRCRHAEHGAEGGPVSWVRFSGRLHDAEGDEPGVKDRLRFTVQCDHCLVAAVVDRIDDLASRDQVLASFTARGHYSCSRGLERVIYCRICAEEFGLTLEGLIDGERVVASTCQAA